MGAYLDRVNARRNSPEATAHRVALFLSTPDRRAVLTEASGDCSFYSVLLARLPANDCEVEFVSAHNRKGVLDSLDLLAELGKESRSFGIIDRDLHFDDAELRCDGRCVVLDVYSFENYLLQAGFLRGLAAKLFGLEFDDPWRQAWSDAVDVFEASLPAQMLSVHAKALVSRRGGVVCNLRNFSPTKHMKADANGTLVANDDFEQQFDSQTGLQAADVDNTVKMVATQELLAREWRSWIRGHYAAELLLSFINAFREQLDSDRKRQNQNRTRTRPHVSDSQLINLAASTVSLPDVLQRFFSQVVMQAA